MTFDRAGDLVPSEPSLLAAGWALVAPQYDFSVTALHCATGVLRCRHRPLRVLDSFQEEMPSPRSADFRTAQLQQVPLFQLQQPSPGPQASSVPLGAWLVRWSVATRDLGMTCGFARAFVLPPFRAKVSCELIEQQPV
ncbi:hypothetical protein MAPG_00073 [Magnaporthiopsis poae ATCC 64411]|uniref:Uncharacterized protein n=1 Tax=Magnaporthiopsis poae (strain ATCC 64411 / 73-15) TaxID=644358 RepID=A0A0C4DK10_MAGP6|nr:hypothetical protein MAPG_00073 [Magnaporthiopsis poae ATCC 64411]